MHQRNNGVLLIMCVCVVVLCLFCSSLYVFTNYTTPYNNGYNDYPNNTTYNEVKDTREVSNTVNSYCVGYEERKLVEYYKTKNANLKAKRDKAKIDEEKVLNAKMEKEQMEKAKIDEKRVMG
jgi:hypothetical protein